MDAHLILIQFKNIDFLSNGMHCLDVWEILNQHEFHGNSYPSQVMRQRDIVVCIVRLNLNGAWHADVYLQIRKRDEMLDKHVRIELPANGKTTKNRFDKTNFQ